MVQGKGPEWPGGPSPRPPSISRRLGGESSFERAIQIARGANRKIAGAARNDESPRLLRDTNRRHETRAMLADIYGWFTEGCDTTDLKDANALLDERYALHV